MNDFFYFTRAAITLRDVMTIAGEAGYRAFCFSSDTSGDDRLNIYYVGEQFWQWIPLHEREGDFDSFAPPNREIVAAYQPVSAFIIAHDVLSWPQLRSFLKRVLERHGGWIGNDTDGWEPVYTADTIGHLPYPHYRETLAWRERTGQRLTGRT